MPSRRSIAATTSSAPAICGTRSARTKLAASTRAQPGGGEPVDEVGAHLGREHVWLVLQPVARAHVAERDASRPGSGR